MKVRLIKYGNPGSILAGRNSLSGEVMLECVVKGGSKVSGL